MAPRTTASEGQNEKGLRELPHAGLKKSRRRPTLPLGLPSSTIGSKELNFRDRDGIGCGLLDITTGNLSQRDLPVAPLNL